MTGATHDREARLKECVVAVYVDGKRVGTGFVVAEDLVVTCAHVIDDIATSKPTSKSVKVKPALAVEDEKADAEITRWQPAEEADIAFLRCTLKRDEVFVARLREIGDHKPSKCDAFGYPSLDDIDGVFANADYLGLVDTASGRQLIQVESKQLTHGFSGAPLVDRGTGRVVGMVVSVVRNDIPEFAGRLDSTAFAIPVSDLAKIEPDLIVETSTLETDHKQALQHLKQGSVVELKKSKIASDALASAIETRLENATPRKSNDKEQPQAVTDALFDSSLADVLDIVIECYHSLASAGADPDGHAINAIISFGSHLFPAVYDEDQLRAIRAGIGSPQAFLLLPSTTCTIVEILMAGVDGRKALFSAPFSPDHLPGGECQIREPPEEGMTTENFEREFENALYEVLKIPFPFRASGKINEAITIKLKDERQRFYYVFTESAEPKIDNHREQIVKGLKQKYQGLVFVKQRKPPDDGREFTLLYRLQDMFQARPATQI